MEVVVEVLALALVAVGLAPVVGVAVVGAVVVAVVDLKMKKPAYETAIHLHLSLLWWSTWGSMQLETCWALSGEESAQTLLVRLTKLSPHHPH